MIFDVASRAPKTVCRSHCLSPWAHHYFNLSSFARRARTSGSAPWCLPPRNLRLLSDQQAWPFRGSSQWGWRYFPASDCQASKPRRRGLLGRLLYWCNRWESQATHQPLAWPSYHWRAPSDSAQRFLPRSTTSARCKCSSDCGWRRSWLAIASSSLFQGRRRHPLTTDQSCRVHPKRMRVELTWVSWVWCLQMDFGPSWDCMWRKTARVASASSKAETRILLPLRRPLGLQWCNLCHVKAITAEMNSSFYLSCKTTSLFSYQSLTSLLLSRFVVFSSDYYVQNSIAITAVIIAFLRLL